MSFFISFWSFFCCEWFIKIERKGSWNSRNFFCFCPLVDVKMSYLIANYHNSFMNPTGDLFYWDWEEKLLWQRSFANNVLGENLLITKWRKKSFEEQRIWESFDAIATFPEPLFVPPTQVAFLISKWVPSAALWLLFHSSSSINYDCSQTVPYRTRRNA